MTDAYKKEVVLDYKKKLADGKLPQLVSLSPARLRTECENVLKERPAEKDYHVLRSFFGPKENGRDYVQIIENFDVDKFRPLINFLRGNTNDTDKKNIELLAWLIDFEPRPYKVRDAYDISVTAPLPKTGPGESRAFEEDLPEPQDSDTRKEEIPPHKKLWINGNLKKAVLAFIATAVICSGIYLILRNNNQECMYWTGDHYEPISCDEKAGDAAIIALDTFKVVHLRKITRPDTITRKALGRVWYAKVKVDSAEFYTASGDYPIDNRKRLLPITEYIMRKYIFDK